jgi:hypothetical protein
LPAGFGNDRPSHAQYAAGIGYFDWDEPRAPWRAEAPSDAPPFDFPPRPRYQFDDENGQCPGPGPCPYPQPKPQPWTPPGPDPYAPPNPGPQPYEYPPGPNGADAPWVQYALYALAVIGGLAALRWGVQIAVQAGALGPAPSPAVVRRKTVVIDDPPQS